MKTMALTVENVAVKSFHKVGQTPKSMVKNVYNHVMVLYTENCEISKL